MKHLKLTFLLVVLMSMIAQLGHAQIALIQYDGLYYSINDYDGTAQLVGDNYMNGSFSGYINDDYRGDIVIPEKIVQPTWEQIEGEEPYDHSFWTVAVIEGDYDPEFWIYYRHNTFRVLSIGQAFISNLNVISVSLPNSITSIDDLAFYSCYNLTSVNIPSSVKSIGDYAFAYCNNLTSVTIESDIPITISDNVFYHSNQTNSTLYVPLFSKAVYEREDCWKEFKEIVPVNMNIHFEDPLAKTICVANWDTNNDGELSMTEAAAVTSLGEVFTYDYDNYNYNNVIKTFDELRFFKGITSIDGETFSGCLSLTSITIPSNVTNIDRSAFNYMSGLESIKVDPENKVYDSRYNCNAIIETRTNTLISGCYKTVIPNSIKVIGWWAFRGHRGLSSISIPYGVTIIREYAFEHTGLTDVRIPNSVSEIGCYAFYSTPWYDNQPDGLIYVGKVAYKYKGTMPENTSITIKEGTLGIAGWAFSGCKGLVSVNIPNSVTNIGNYAFYGCDLNSISIPESVCKIGGAAFYETPWLDSLPNGLVYIGNIMYVDKGRKSGPTVELRDGTKSISSWAFSDNEDLVSIIIPSSVNEIGGTGLGTFQGCSNLISVTIKREWPISINDDWEFPDRNNATLYVPKGCKSVYKGADFWKDFKEIVEIEDPHYEISDDTTSFYIAKEESGCIVEFTHNFNGEWEALYLPFAIDYDAIKADFDLAEIDGVVQNDDNNDGTIDFTVLSIRGFKEQMTEPNTPYLIRAKNTGEQTISFEDITVYPTTIASIDCSSTSTKYEFTGSYNALDASALTNRYVVQDGQLVKGASSLAPCRWYMTATSRTGAPLNLPSKIRIMPVEDVITGSPLLTSLKEGLIYNLAGQQMVNGKLPKGINIIRMSDGTTRKVIMR